jgi:hypothetical protein
MNQITITGPQEVLVDFYHRLKKLEGHTEGELYILKSYVPMPEELHGTKFPGNAPNWYDWAMCNWGSKWGDYDTSLDFDGDRITGWYSSAWGPCNEGILNVSKLFPTLNFKVNYHEPGMNFRGYQVCDNGVEIEGWCRDMTEDDLCELGYDYDEEEEM